MCWIFYAGSLEVIGSFSLELHDLPANHPLVCQIDLTTLLRCICKVGLTVKSLGLK